MTDDMREAFYRGYRAGFIDAALVDGVATQDVDSPAIQMSMKNHADKDGVEPKTEQAQGEADLKGAFEWSRRFKAEKQEIRGFVDGYEPTESTALSKKEKRIVCAAIEAFLRQSRPAPEAVPDLPETQEPKYTVANGQIVNRASGEAIPGDEPVFIFRARDVHAREVLGHYACQLIPGDHRDAVVRRIEHFARFTGLHPERMKKPDTAADPAPSSSGTHNTR